MAEDRPYDIKIKFILPATKKEIQFNMRTTVWSLDMNLQAKSLTPTQELNAKELWIGRLIDCVEGMTDAKLRVIDQYTMNYLCNKWLEYNDPNSSFLGLGIPEESLKNIMMSKSS
jgi:hypothetical protein